MAVSGTHKLAAVAIGCAGGAFGLELRALLRDRDTPTSAGAAREAVEVAVAGYKASPVREAATFNLLASYVIAASAVRGSTVAIRKYGQVGPFLRNRHVRGRHLHHYLPGIGLAFAFGGASIVARDEELDKWFAIPFGVGAALTMDEAALLLALEDVYWTEEGLLSVQATLVVTACLGSLALARRLLRRGAGEEGAEPARLAEDGLVAAGADADERDRDADEV